MILYHCRIAPGTFLNWFLGVFNCVIFFPRCPDFKGGGSWSHVSTLTGPRFLHLSHVMNLYPLYVLFLFTFCLFFVLLEYIWGNYFAVPVYNDVLGPAEACPVVWGFFSHSLNTSGWHFHPGGVIVSLTYTPYLFSLYFIVVILMQLVFLGNQQQQVNLKSNQQVPLVIGNKNANIRVCILASLHVCRPNFSWN